ncbi:MAG TPA: hypothetical protein VFZ22_05115 [Pyrinomonadaceae bacterium]|nr:hypothetical protein [Pyrinomonadaceae bacterium]
MRDVLAGREPEKGFNWDESWLASMFRSGEVAEQRKLEMERRMGLTPEVKRYNEIKAGVITSSVGIGIAIFLFIFMQGVAGSVPPNEAEVLTRLWVAGAIPFMVGLALIINGLVVSKKQAEIMERETRRAKGLPQQMAEDQTPQPRTLAPADTNEFIPTHFSVTDQTTRHLVNSEPEPKR